MPASLATFRGLQKADEGLPTQLDASVVGFPLIAMLLLMLLPPPPALPRSVTLSFHR